VWNFFGIFGDRRASSARAASVRRRLGKPSGTRYFRPCLEGFEDRVVPAAPILNAAQVAPAALAPAFNITGVQLTNFQIVNGVLHAAGTVTGTLAGLPFTTQISDFALQLVPDNPNTPATECSVLHLELAPIHLQLLGLHVDTSRICLDITATEGGGILGDLLCGLAGGPTHTAPVLPTLTQVGDLQNGLINLLNGALAGAAPGKGDGSVCTGECTVLDLSLGPVDLSLLGLNVHLDNCANGPVQVCVSATRSEGLLGSLLCGISGRRNTNFTLSDLNSLVNTATDLLSDGVLSGRDHGRLTSLVSHLKH
jgi:hypothetical protein